MGYLETLESGPLYCGVRNEGDESEDQSTNPFEEAVNKYQSEFEPLTTSQLASKLTDLRKQEDAALWVEISLNMSADINVHPDIIDRDAQINVIEKLLEASSGE